ncbi:Secretion protein HlyD [Roseovarius sp. TM1035]|uniref:Macrolide export protein MacA n=1 Tax=Roseovarius mucosus TaxID=215743 RepID=A0A1V0RUG6_9RHOB|nr:MULTISPECIES: efflux RND transporter periplasmic adaptor subunit [Roseovarius]ARE85212.1 macrolide export protein MacA [Roseovarius mucosus]AWZ21309.1 putative RND efflux membrane fusion protein [Roseovarius sp. AK1035]EDM30799.1 Secretion protein HlyD [Roseovarius sp. TM1035]
MAAALVGMAIAGLITAQAWMARPPTVLVETAALAPVTRVLAVNGRIAAVNSVEVTSTVTGTLVALPVIEGDRVEAGQILAQVDAEAQSASVRQAQAALDAARDALREAQAEFDRATSLTTTIARSVRDTYGYRLEAATQEVARLGAALDQARVLLANHTIRAPVAGSVVMLDVEQGQLVSPATPILTLADLSALLVEADVDEAYATQIAVAQPALLQLAGETQTRAGQVSYVSKRVDIATGGLAVELSFDTPVLAPVGLTVATNIIVDQRDAALTVPRTALVSDAGAPGVFVIRDGTARFQPISVVEWPAARLIVTAGLAQGDTFITEATGIADGQAVTAGPP